MSQPEEFKRRKRTRVGGPSQQGRLLGVVVFLSALLLATMVLTASLDLPPPAATLPTPTPDLAAAAPRLYLVGTYIERDASIPRLAALDLATRQPIYSLDNVRDAALSADGRRLYTLETNRVTALATATKQTLWRLDLAPLAATDDQPPTLLALTPDQKTLLIYRQELDFAANSARAWIEQVDVGTHQPNALNINIATPHVVETIEIAADGHTLFLVGYNAISGLDLRDGTQTQLVAAPSGGLGAVLSADRLRLFVVDREGWIAEYDTLSQRVIQRVRLQDPELAPVGGSASLALAPHSDRLALLVSQRGTPTIVRGELVEETSGQALIVVSLDDGTLVRRSARSHYAQPLAWSGAGEQIYFVEFGQVYRWQIGADRGWRGWLNLKWQRPHGGGSRPADHSAPAAAAPAAPRPRPQPLGAVRSDDWPQHRAGSGCPGPPLLRCADVSALARRRPTGLCHNRRPQPRRRPQRRPPAGDRRYRHRCGDCRDRCGPLGSDWIWAAAGVGR